MNKHPKIFQNENSALLVIDIQEKLIPVIYENERVVENTVKLVKGFKVLNVPIFYTEQYSKGLGPTESRIKEVLQARDSMSQGESRQEIEPVHKMSFSCSSAGNLFDELKNKGIERIVLCGVESHVCVMQTCLDLLANGFQVQIAADAVSSRRKFDWEIALERMRSNGAEITLTESVLFEMLNVCGTDEFKAISKILK